MTPKMKRRDLIRRSVAMSLGLGAGSTAFGAADENPFPPKKIVYAQPHGYSPLAYLNASIPDPPRLGFSAKTVAEADMWRNNLRDKLGELLGEPYVPGSFRKTASRLSSEQLDGYTREKWEIEIAPGRVMPFYVLIPGNASKPYRTVLCLHGHGNGARDIIGQPVNAEAAELIGILNTDYALQCVKRGWCAVAPELFAFGERVDFVEDARSGFDGGCEKPFLNAVEVGKTLIGIRAKDIMTLTDWMTANKDFDCSNLPCIGLSGGGMMTMYTAALDDRIKRVLIAGYVTEAKDSIMAIRHCSCNYIPHLLEWADFPDVTGLIAPRPLIVQTGRKDAIFPLSSVERAVARIKKVYALYGVPDKIRLDIHDGYHAFYSPSLDDLLA